MRSTGYDVAIIGGGILGLATALELSHRHPRRKVAVIEKEESLAAHQTGHNSGVIHSGIYYKPGSLKAKACVAGARSLLEFCDRNNVKYELCGKLVVATNNDEVPILNELYRRGMANGVPGLELAGPERLKELEPHATGVMALHSPNTGIIDYADVTNVYARKFLDNGGDVITGSKVLGINQHQGVISLATTRGDIQTIRLINCAGLYADTIARMAGVKKGVQIIPFRGEYYILSSEIRHLVKNMIYPVPNPKLPFLGVHLTRTIHGVVEAGPNAVLALAREGYTMGSVNLRETLEILAYRGFWAMTAKHWKAGVREVHHSFSKSVFAKALQRLVPEIEEIHLSKGGSGVRAQAVDHSGSLIDDFCISETQNAIHIQNAPSPGATASLAIAHDIVSMAEKSFRI